MLTAIVLFGQHTSAAAEIDAASLDVAGIRLGMTKSEALTALSAFDSSMSVQPEVKLTVDPSLMPVPDIWHAIPAIVAISRDFEKVGIAFKNVDKDREQCMLKYNYGTREYAHCDDVEKKERRSALANFDSPRVIAVWVSPIQNRVIAVSSTTYFVKSIPSAENVVDTILKKYAAKPTSVHQERDKTSLIWKFDSQNHLSSSVKSAFTGLIQSDEVRAYVQQNLAVEHFEPAVFLPYSVTEEDHVILQAAIVRGVFVYDGVPAFFPAESSRTQEVNNLLAQRTDVVLYDSALLTGYLHDRMLVDEGQKQQRDKAQADKAQTTIPKF